jgi:protein gp37
MKIPISQIITDPQVQPRSALSSGIIQEYAELWKEGIEFPPIIVYTDGDSKLWLADGWHRLLAAKVANISDIETDVRIGTLRDAILYSVGANFDHGMRRTNEDKERAVKKLLGDEKWAKWSDREIARRCKVDHETVGKLRGYLAKSPDNNRIVERDGTTYIQNTSNIGKKSESMTDDDPEQKTDRDISSLEKIEEAIRSRSQFNRTNDNIEWAAWSWNPVTGCEHNCNYCYARDIANRFYPQGFKPTFYPERLEAPVNTNPILDIPGGNKVFICSMADLFGSWVPNEWIESVMNSVKNNPQWTFIFLTKNPKRLASIIFPENAWVGCTVDIQARVKSAEDAMSKVTALIKFVSCEPMLEPLQFNNLSIFDWVIIGAQSRTCQVPEFQPNPKWYFDLVTQAWNSDCKVYIKPNLTSRPREYPE